MRKQKPRKSRLISSTKEEKNRIESIMNHNIKTKIPEIKTTEIEEYLSLYPTFEST